MISNRLNLVRMIMVRNGIGQLVISKPQDIFYLTGFWVDAHDRLDVLIITQDSCQMLCHDLAVIYPPGCKVTIYSNTSQTINHLSGLLINAVTGIDGFLQSRFLLPLIETMPKLKLKISTCVEEARMYKDADEISRLRFASEITDRVFANALGHIREEMTELELGDIFSACFAQEGVGYFHGNPMVSFGDNSSFPHHSPGKTRLRPGDTICIDTGKRINGYYSDMTRTFFFKSCSKEQRKIYEIVLEANMAALQAVKPGALIRDIHFAASNIIGQAGFSKYFPHRTSHGIGIDYHEEPFDLDNRALQVAEGMCFSIEPGIYLPNQFGIRIEDLIVVTNNGCSLLNHAPKNLTVIA